MAGYQRKTALAPGEVLKQAEAHLPEYLGLSRSSDSSHKATYKGKEGWVTLVAHRHGAYTDVVAETNSRLRTSRIDYEVQRFLATLPYEHGDHAGARPSDFGR